MKRGLWIAIAVGIVLILIGVVVILMFVPLGPGLSTLSPDRTITPAGADESSGTLDTPVTSEIQASTTPSEGGCASGVTTFMVLGESLPPRGTDAIRLVRVDFDNKRVDILSIPSELWVATPGLADSGISAATLNDVYSQGKTLVTGNDQARMLAAASLFADTLKANFGYTPEHYLVIKEEAFSEFVDALDGVDVTLPVAVDGRKEGKGYFPAGFQHLTGAMALNLVRITGTTEWERFDRQELIIQAIYQSMLIPENWDRLPALVEAFHENVLTDLSVTQILEVSCVFNQPGVVVTQEQTGPELVIISGETMLPRPELGQYILQTVGK
jgi:LCP family protein required for cell wall assembly